MTLAKYGIQYGSWSSKQVKDFAILRGIELPRRNDRKLWIQTIRAKDQEVTITFLDFPPEIRNMVYGVLLNLERKGGSEDRVACHPAILATCKRVFTEAAGIFYAGSELPISVSLTNRYIGIPEGYNLHHHYGVDVIVNGRTAVRGQDCVRMLIFHGLRAL